MGDRPAKRAWLRLIGAVADERPSTSAVKAITPAEIDSTLGAVRDDNVWVALACIDAVQSSSLVLRDDASCCRHIIELGLRRMNVTQAPDLDDTPTLQSLAIRNVLCRYRRLLDVWEKLHQNRGGARPTQSIGAANSDANDDDDDDDFDAWADVAETTPSPLPSAAEMDLAQFLQTGAEAYAMQCVKANNFQQLAAFLRILPRSLASSMYHRRLTLVKQLLLTSSSAGYEPKVLLELKLLPGLSQEKESGLWAECMDTSIDDVDIFDREDVQQALHRHRLVDIGEAPGAGEPLHGQLSPLELLTFYRATIDTLQTRKQTVSGAFQLADLVSSGQLGSLSEGSFVQFAEDLRLYRPLITKGAASLECASWTLQRFRDELIARPDLRQKQKMAALYVERAASVEDAIDAARNGAVPFLHAITQKSINQQKSDAPNEALTSTGYQLMILALADAGNVRVVRLLLEAGSECGVDLSSVESSSLALACFLGTASTSPTIQEELSKLISTAASSMPQNLSIQAPPLRTLLATPLLDINGHAAPPSRLHHFLTRLDEASLQYHIERCRGHLPLCQQLSAWHGALTPALLASIQGDRVEQVKCITRIVRTFARESKSQSQWAYMADYLLNNVGSNKTFDQMQTKDAARVVLEAALRTGDTRVYSQSVKDLRKAHLSPPEEDDLVLSASRELYDNSTSANLHQGDMKVAYEMLSLFDSHSGPRIEQEKAFIEASSRLCSFRVQSALRSGALVSPIEIRLSQDRLDFIKQLLESKEDAYKTPDLIIEMACKLCAVPSGSAVEKKADIEASSPPPSRLLTESRTLALLTEAALGQSDYMHAQSSCERLVANTISISKRAEQSTANKQQGVGDAQNEQLEQLHQRIKEVAYKTCFLLCNQHEWTDYASRLRWASFVVAYCPEDRIERYLKTWRQIEQLFQKELIDHPANKDWDDQMIIQFRQGVAGQAAGAGGLGLSAIGAGSSLAGSLAAIGNLSALESLGPFGSLFGSARLLPTLSSSSYSSTPSSVGGKIASKEEQIQQQNQHPHQHYQQQQQQQHHPRSASQTRDEAAMTATGNSSPSSRAARLFDSLGGGDAGAGRHSPASDHHSAQNTGYLDPAERAARAARRFFGGFA